MEAIVTYHTGSYTGSGRLGKFTKDAVLLEKKENKHGVNRLVMAVADDSGAFPSGFHPVETAVAMIEEFFNSDYFEKMKTAGSDPEMENQVKDLFNRINTLVYGRGIQEGQHIRLSLTAAFIVEDFVFAGHIGTCSIMKVTNDKPVVLNDSDTALSRAIKDRNIPMDQAIQSDMLGIKTPTMGLEPAINCQYIMETLLPGDRIIVFTDGISEYIPVQEIKVIFDSVDTKQGACTRLVSIAKERGLKDNASIAAVSLDVVGDTDGKSVQEIVNERKKRQKQKSRGGCTCNTVWFGIVFLILLIMGGAAYLGYEKARVARKNIEKSHTRPVEPVASEEPENPEPESGPFFLVKESDTMKLNFFRLNGRKLDLNEEKYEIVDTQNNLEILPVLLKGTYNITLKFNTRPKYKIYGYGSRNLVQIQENNIRITLTKGAVAELTPQYEEGVTYLVISGLASPVKVTFGQQNLIMKVTKDSKQK